jgi:HD-GYP domain
MSGLRLHFWQSLQGRVLTVITLSLLTLTCLIVVGVSLLSNHMTGVWADLYFTVLSEKAEMKVRNSIAQVQAFSELGASDTNSQAPIRGDGTGNASVTVMRQFLMLNDSIYSVYVGKRDGSFLQLVRVPESGGLDLGYAIPAGTAGVLRVIPSDPGRRHLWAISFLGADGTVLGRTEADTPAYDPRERTWFKEAMASSSSILTEPYRYVSIPSLGITAARTLADGSGVFGVDMTLDALKEELSRARVSDNGVMVMLDRGGRLLAASRNVAAGSELEALGSLDDPLFQAMAEVKAWTSFGKAMPIAVTGTDYLVWMSTPQTFGNIAIAAPAADFFGATRNTLVAMTGLAMLVLALVVLTAQSILRPVMGVLRALTDDAERVSEMDFTGELPDVSPVRELDALADAMEMMKRTLLRHTSSLSESQSRLRRLIEVGAAMASEHDLNKLIEAILQEAKSVGNAEGGSLFVCTEDRALRVECVRNDVPDVSSGDRGGGREDERISPPTLSLLAEDGSPNLSNPAAAAVHQRKSINIPDVHAAGYDLTPFREAGGWLGERTQSMLVVPLITSGGEVVGVVQLVNARVSGREGPVPFSSSVQLLVQALASQAAAALHNRMLLDAQDRLMDSIVRLLAGAIDAKSPYTGDHASRVPKIATCIAEALCEQRSDVRERWFSTPEQWRAFRMASWLHDCGKITSPEFVMDKATKLETVYNRIHEIRTRFEVLLRDAEIARLKGGMSDGDFERRRRQLQDDFAFVAQCNLGAESMSDDKIARIRQIGAQAWLRHFDDRLGLAYEELGRVNGREAQPLPATEALLADREDQRIPWDPREWAQKTAVPFKVKVPELMYNRGEIYNLSIQRGTLTPEERYRIIDHAIQTIRILEDLPLPQDLKLVPLIAGAHHETLNGKGYPRGLSADDLPPPARILAIADIFDALVAPDRPYKKAKMLSEALGILAGFRDRGEIDAEIFEIFLTSGAMRRYAEEWLPASQIDEVELERYIPRLAG